MSPGHEAFSDAMWKTLKRYGDSLQFIFQVMF